MINIIKAYVYKLTHKITGQFYFGYREENIRFNRPAILDLGIKYKTSSKIIAEIGFDNFNYEILYEYEDGNDAFDHEQRLIFEHWGNPLLLNENVRLANGEKRFKAKKGEDAFNFGKTWEEMFGEERA